jgi:hypothetical protein
MALVTALSHFLILILIVLDLYDFLDNNTLYNSLYNLLKHVWFEDGSINRQNRLPASHAMVIDLLLYIYT